MNKHGLWTRDFIINSITNLIIYLVYYILMVTIAVYAADNLQASPSQAGLASGIFILGTLVSRLFAGRAIDRVGRKKMLYFGLIFFLITTLLYFGIKSLIFLFIIRFLHGAGFGFSNTATATIMASIVPAERRGEGTSYFAMSSALASAAGPFLGMFLISQGSLRVILALATILLSLSFIAVFFLRVPEAKLTKDQLDRLKGFKLNSIFEAKAVPISVINIFMGLTLSSILAFLTTYTREINLADAGRFFFIVYAASIFVSRPLTGSWFDRKGENFVMYPSFVLFAIGLVILSQAHQDFYLLLAGAVMGLGYGTFMSSAQAIAVKVSPSHRIGLATSTFYIFIDCGLGIGPYLLGLLIPVSGLRGMYATMAIVAFACSFLYYFLHGRKAGQTNDQVIHLRS